MIDFSNNNRLVTIGLSNGATFILRTASQLFHYYIRKKIVDNFRSLVSLNPTCLQNRPMAVFFWFQINFGFMMKISRLLNT